MTKVLDTISFFIVFALGKDAKISFDRHRLIRTERNTQFCRIKGCGGPPQQ